MRSSFIFFWSPWTSRGFYFRLRSRHAHAANPALAPHVALVFDSRTSVQPPNEWTVSKARYPWGGKASYQLLGDYITPALEAGLSVLVSVEAGPHWAVDYQSLAELEWLFQRYPAPGSDMEGQGQGQVLGIRVGEMFWNWRWYQPGVQALKQSYVRAREYSSSAYDPL